MAGRGRRAGQGDSVACGLSSRQDSAPGEATAAWTRAVLSAAEPEPGWECGAESEPKRQQDAEGTVRRVGKKDETGGPVGSTVSESWENRTFQSEDRAALEVAELLADLSHTRSPVCAERPAGCGFGEAVSGFLMVSRLHHRDLVSKGSLVFFLLRKFQINSGRGSNKRTHSCVPVTQVQNRQVLLLFCFMCFSAPARSQRVTGVPLGGRLRLALGCQQAGAGGTAAGTSERKSARHPDACPGVSRRARPHADRLTARHTLL